MTLASAPQPVRVAPSRPEKLVPAYGDELLEMARSRPDIVVMDADLPSDCGIEAFKAELPARFIAQALPEVTQQAAASAEKSAAVNCTSPAAGSGAPVQG